MDCTFPVTIKNPKTREYMKVPCGMCMSCRLARVRDWSARLLDEDSSWKSSVFITITYDNDHLPLTNCGRSTLVKSDLQKFIKRLRKHMELEGRDSAFKGTVLPGKSPPLLRYFACGEYGDEYGRPHYHLIVFGLSPSDRNLILKCWDKCDVRRVTTTPVIIERIHYVTSYVQKKWICRDPKDFFNYGCVQPPFQLMSQGLGLDFFRLHEDEYIYSKTRTIKGVKYSFPRYYLKKSPQFKEIISEKGRVCTRIALAKEQSALDEGRDIIMSRLQRNHDLIARATKLKKGIL